MRRSLFVITCNRLTEHIVGGRQRRIERLAIVITGAKW